MEPKIRLKGFSGNWETRTLSEYFKKVCVKNTKMEYTTVLTNSAEHGVIPQSDFFDHAIANNKNIGGYYIVSPDDFVYNPRVSVTAPVGPINRSLLDYSGVMSPLYLVFKINGINKDYLNIFYKTNKWHNFMKLEGNCGARFDRLSIGDDQFVKMPLTHPKDNDEQQAIADYFQHLDSLIQSTTKKIESLKQVKAASLQAMFPQEGETTPRVRFKGFEGEWEKKQFSELYESSSIKNKDFGADKIISVANMYFKPVSYISDEEYLKSYNVMNLGDIAFEGNKSKNYAHGRFVENTIGDGIVSHVFIVLKPISKQYDLQFWKYLINYERIMGPVLLRSTKHSTMMTDLVVSDFLKESVLVPSYEEQKAIGAFLQNLDSQITLQTQRLEKLKQIKSACLDNMFV